MSPSTSQPRPRQSGAINCPDLPRHRLVLCRAHAEPIPADSHHNWDRRQYVAHIAALVLIWWTAALVPPLLVEGRARLRRACRNYGVAAVLAAMVAAALLFARQVPTVLMIVATGNTNPMGLIYPDLFEVMEHAPDAWAAAVLAAWSLSPCRGRGWTVELARKALLRGRGGLGPDGAVGPAGLGHDDPLAHQVRHHVVTGRRPSRPGRLGLTCPAPPGPTSTLDVTAADRSRTTVILSGERGEASVTPLTELFPFPWGV